MKQLMLMLISFCYVSVGMAQVNSAPKKKTEKEETPEFIDQWIEEETVREMAPPPPPPPPPPSNGQREIFKVVENMPLFNGAACMELPAGEERQACGQQEMLNYVYKNIKYPNIARLNNTEGIVVINFVVEKDGSIKDAKVIRDIGGGCGKEALRVVNSFPKWQPGTQRGQAVAVYYNLPVKFKLEDDKSKKKKKKKRTN